MSVVTCALRFNNLTRIVRDGTWVWGQQAKYSIAGPRLLDPELLLILLEARNHRKQLRLGANTLARGQLPAIYVRYVGHKYKLSPLPVVGYETHTLH